MLLTFLPGDVHEPKIGTQNDLVKLQAHLPELLLNQISNHVLGLTFESAEALSIPSNPSLFLVHLSRDYNDTLIDQSIDATIRLLDTPVEQIEASQKTGRLRGKTSGGSQCGRLTSDEVTELRTHLHIVGIARIASANL